VGYARAELLGENWQHHRLFVDPGYAAKREYSRFWTALREGIPQQGEF
jgi:methyl-accepting chemotaxis protein